MLLFSPWEMQGGRLLLDKNLELSPAAQKSFPSWASLFHGPLRRTVVCPNYGFSLNPPAHLKRGHNAISSTHQPTTNCWQSLKLIWTYNTYGKREAFSCKLFSQICYKFLSYIFFLRKTKRWLSVASHTLTIATKWYLLSSQTQDISERLTLSSS